MGNLSRRGSAGLTVETLMGLIDYTNLKAFSQEKQIRELVHHAGKLGAYAVCILPEYALLARDEIRKGRLNLKLAITADYPLGGSMEQQRIGEVRALAGIADEIDVMARIGAIKSGKYGDVELDMRRLAETAHSGGMKIKMIIETAYLTREEKVRVCEIALKSDVDFIKTSSGFAESEYTAQAGNSNTGATTDDVKLIANICKQHGKGSVGIKASGGIRAGAQILGLLKASGRKADPSLFRIGTSAVDNIYNEFKSGKLDGN